MLLPFPCQPCNPLPSHRAAHTRASRSIGRSRDGAGIPHQRPTTDSNSTEPRNLTPKPSVTAVYPLAPLGNVLSLRAPGKSNIN